MRSGPSDDARAARAALLGTGAVMVGALALTESFRELPVALAAYAAAWWVLGLDGGVRSRARETR
jgi:hypothetical protein